MANFYDSFVGGQRNALARQATEQDLAHNALLDQQYQQSTDAKQTLAETEWALQSPDPIAAVKSLPHIAQAWQQHGIDINTLDPDHARAILTEGRARAASALGETFGAPQAMQYQGQPALAQVGNAGTVRPIPGAAPYEKPPTETGAPVQVMRGGKPVYENPRAAIGQEAYNKPSAGDNYSQNSVETTATMIANGQIPMLSGFALKTPWGQAVVARVGQIAPATPGEAGSGYQGNTYATRAAALKSFTSGPLSSTVRSLNVGIAHLGTLNDLATALNNGDTQLLNKAANAWKTQTGNPAPTNFAGARSIVANEIVKAVTASGGGVTDRQEAQAEVSSANSPEQLAGVISTWKQLLSGQLGGLKQQYEQGTQNKDFNRFLSPEVIAQLEGGDQASTPAQTTGPTATGPNGEKIQVINGQWVPVK